MNLQSLTLARAPTYPQATGTMGQTGPVWSAGQETTQMVMLSQSSGLLPPAAYHTKHLSCSGGCEGLTGHRYVDPSATQEGTGQ